FVEKNTDASSKAGAQGLLMMFNNGLGTILGMTTLQAVLNRFTQSVNVDGVFYKTGNWTGFWITCAIYALTIGVLFAIFFRYKDKKTE
ncbi:MAG: MFS transporter, partial [Bacteroidaceae bacterium]|nr:MFS transporter [Bacteroidaceae bacterium]